MPIRGRSKIQHNILRLIILLIAADVDAFYEDADMFVADVLEHNFLFIGEHVAMGWVWAIGLAVFYGEGDGELSDLAVG